MSDDFGRLIAVEAELDRRLAEARGEADRMVRAAREDLAAREAGLEAELAEAGRNLQAEIDADLTRKAGEILAQARVEASRFQRVSPEQIQWLADRLLDRLVGELP